ncbi:MAG: urate hydroxylase PuuD [Acidimicrobiia bacterium]|nr:urate hydroxylase PuuD [Acidimicrobiia bacterium]
MHVLLTSWPLFHRVGGVILSRWAHFLAGVTWIGLLYYFNVVQVPSFAQFEPGPRNEATAKLVPRALWWFRWGAMLTLLSGISILAFQDQFNGDYWKTPSGVSIATGILLALVMFANVWLVIWPHQKRVIANAQNVVSGGAADPTVAVDARRAFLASRTNTLLSIPMLFFMAATSHFAPFHTSSTSGKRGAFLGIVLVVTAILELNALGVLGGTQPGGIRTYLDDHKNTIIAGFAYAVLLILLFEAFFS